MRKGGRWSASIYLQELIYIGEKTHKEREETMGKGEEHSICSRLDSQSWPQGLTLSHFIGTDYRPQAE